MVQYREAKEAHPDALLFFRLGDFYEMFNDDAVIASRELQLTLTARNKKNTDKPVPMAGVPYHAAHNYIAKLLQRGYRIAVCEQMGDPSKLKGLVPRKVVRVLTPGLLTDSDHLEARENNYLAAVAQADSDQFGLALLDLSTGELSACTLGSALLIAEVARAGPAELLLPTELNHLESALTLAAPHTALCNDSHLEADAIAPLLNEDLAAPLYDAAQKEHSSAAIAAAARALRFAKRNLPDTELPIMRLGQHDPHSCMHIDETAQSHLELVSNNEGKRKGSLLGTIDNTVTAAGARLLRQRLLAPLMNVAAIRRRHDAIDLFVQHNRARSELRAALKQIGDIQRLSVRASLGECSPRDLASLRQSLLACPAALESIRSIPQHQTCHEALPTTVDLMPSLAQRLCQTLVDEPPAQLREGGMLRSGWDPDLDELKSLRNSGTERITALEQQLREVTLIPSLKIKFTRAFGHYIEVTKAHLDKVPDAWRRKQTLTNAERYMMPELAELSDKIIGAQESYSEREKKLFADLVQEVATFGGGLRELAQAVATWDVASALAELADEQDYCRPSIDDSTRLTLADARHPVVERFVPSGQFVPNDTTLDLEGERLLLITGPNMAGKSTLMRQVALTIILAQAGSFVPAKSAHIGLVDRVLSRVGASDNLARGESTFMVEMRETATILRHATRRSLVILDEIGRGTSTFDGLAIAWAVTEHLHEAVRCRAMFATHYHELTELAESHPGIANYSVSARERDGSIVFLHRLTAGAVNKSYGIAVARLAGLPESVLGRANAILNSLEHDHSLPDPNNGSDRQLDLFAPPPDPQSEIERAICDQLRGIDPNRMTPLEALQLVAALGQRLGEPGDDTKSQ